MSSKNQSSKGVAKLSDTNEMMNQVVRKMSFEQIQKEVKPIQEELNKVIERHKGIGGGKLSTQEIILNTFFPKNEPIVRTEEKEVIHFNNLEGFINSIPDDAKKKLYDDTMALFLTKMSESEGEK